MLYIYATMAMVLNKCHPYEYSLPGNSTQGLFTPGIIYFLGDYSSYRNAPFLLKVTKKFQHA